MKTNIWKSIWYAVAAFVVVACYFKAFTSSSWYGIWTETGGKESIYVHKIPLLYAVLAGALVLILVASSFKRFPLTMETIHNHARIFATAIVCGGIVFMCWVGIGMFPLMYAPQDILIRLYLDGLAVSASVALILVPLFYRFWKRHGRVFGLDYLK